MARSIHRLPPNAARQLTQPGRHADGGGLYLLVKPSGARSWVFIHQWEGRRRELGLGSVATVPLARAREKAAAARQNLEDGVSPIDARQALKALPTFGEMADAVVKAQSPAWRNAKHRQQWQTTLETDAAALRPLRVDRIATADVLAVLKPIWTVKPETASRLRGRIERVLDAAKAQGFRSGENPARWRGHLDHLLPPRAKLTRGHHRALPYQNVPAFMADLRKRNGVGSLAFQFLILTAARSGEAREARWSEIDLEGAVWTVPAERMKAKRPHRVPLTAPAVAILKTVHPLASAPDAFVFPGLKPGQPLSSGAFDRVLDRMERRVDTTAHGFRSAFRDWAGDATTFPREVAEASLAHVIGDATERAYRRNDALERRRKLMDAWASYCARPASGNVIALRKPTEGAA